MPDAAVRAARRPTRLRRRAGRRSSRRWPRADDELAPRRSVRRPARASARRPRLPRSPRRSAPRRGRALGPGRRRRLPRRRRRAAAHLRRHHRRAVHASRARPRSSTGAAVGARHAAAGRHRRPLAARRRRRAICSTCSPAAPDVRTHLVLPADTPRGVGAPHPRRLRGRPTRRASCITKLDEAESLSPLRQRAARARRCRFPISAPASACPKISSARRPNCWPRGPAANRRCWSNRVMTRVSAPRPRGDRSRSPAAKAASARPTSPINLAVALARLGHRVGILDADFGLGNVDVMLGLTPDAHLGPVLAGEQPLRRGARRRARRASASSRRAPASAAHRPSTDAARCGSRRLSTLAAASSISCSSTPPPGISDNVIDARARRSRAAGHARSSRPRSSTPTR